MRIFEMKLLNNKEFKKTWNDPFVFCLKVLSRHFLVGCGGKKQKKMETWKPVRVTRVRTKKRNVLLRNTGPLPLE
jgi:hypothetical protein